MPSGLLLSKACRSCCGLFPWESIHSWRTPTFSFPRITASRLKQPSSSGTRERSGLSHKALCNFGGFGSAGRDAGVCHFSLRRDKLFPFGQAAAPARTAAVTCHLLRSLFHTVGRYD